MKTVKKIILQWYAVTANYKAVHVGKMRRRHLWEQLVFLVRAASEEGAQAAGYKIGKLKEHSYLTIGGDQIFWQLEEIVQVQELYDQRLKEGMEVNWRFFERTDKPGNKKGD